MHFKLLISFIFLSLFVLYACKKDENQGSSEKSFYTDFSKDKDSWVAEFAEYDGDNAEIYELKEELAYLPEPPIYLNH